MKLKLFHDKITHLTWAVRIVELNDKYGLNDCLTNTGSPLVEFFDTRYEITNWGQFVSRYYLSTLVEGQSDRLCLDGGNHEWNIYGPCYRRILYWLENYDETPS